MGKDASKKQLEPHDFANMLPLMSDLDFNSLKADIARNGLADPIELYQGKILDGRHRYRACVELQIKPKFIRFKGSDDQAIAHVCSREHHRQMTESQRAAAAVNFLPFFEKAAIARQKAGVTQPVAEGHKGESRELAGQLFGVSGYYVSLARKIKEADKKLFEQVFLGKLPVTRAIRLARRNDRRKFVDEHSLAGPASIDDCTFIVGKFEKKSDQLERGKYRLAFFDPPYNLGFKYDADPTRDRMSPKDYAKMIRSAVDIARDLLTPDGTLCVVICEEHVDLFGQIIRAAGFHVRRLIVWFESFGQAGNRNFGRTTRFVWYATKSQTDFVFDEQALLTTAKRESVYADNRVMPGGKVLDSLWEDCPRVCGTYGERVPDEGVPTQLPEKLVKRIVEGFTDPGDSVIDFFGGTGTTARAALALGRKCVLIDRSKKYIDIARRELRAMVAKSQGAK